MREDLFLLYNNVPIKLLHIALFMQFHNFEKNNNDNYMETHYFESMLKYIKIFIFIIKTT